MENSKLRSIISSVGLPRIIITGFFLLLCFGAVRLDLDLADLLSNALSRTGQNGILVLAMVPAIQCGIGLNFGISLGVIGGLLGGLIAIELGLTGWASLVVACIIGMAIASVIGYGYGQVLNRVKGSEMTVSTYVGFSIVALMNIAWLVLPFKNLAIRWPIGEGLRSTVSLDEAYGHLLNNFLTFSIGDVRVPTGSLLLLLISCFLMSLFLKSKAGLAMTSAGSNPMFAKSAGINVDKMRILGTAISTAVAALGIITYSSSYGFIQLYNAPLLMGFSAAAAILVGGASIKKANVIHVIVGVFLFQSILSMGLPVANKILPEGNLSEVMRLIISNGIILYALTKTKEGQ